MYEIGSKVIRRYDGVFNGCEYKIVAVKKVNGATLYNIIDEESGDIVKNVGAQNLSGVVSEF